MKSKFLILGLSVLLSISCKEEDSLVPNQISEFTNRNTSDLPLKDAAPFPVGNAWSAGHPTWGGNKGTDLGGPSDDFTGNAFGPLSTAIKKQLDLTREYEILAREFNSITPEVALKPHNMAVSPDSIDFSEADAMMAFAEANNIRVHGHVILFDNSVPEWAFEYEANGTWTEEQWESWLEDYITRVVGRYRGRIASWDVLNEIASPLGGGLKQGYFWRKVIGPDFIEKAFKWVEAADPDAKLFINDWGMPLIPSKLDAVLQLAEYLKAAGCKVDGIGFQGHIVLPFLQGGYQMNYGAYKKVADAGYLVHISELDMSVNLLGIEQRQSPVQQRLQRKRYNDIARAYMDAVPSEQQWGITLWNISDRNSFYNVVKIWLDLQIFGGPDFPLLWDDQYFIKPAYYGFRNGLEGIVEGWFDPPLFSTERVSPTLSEGRLSSQEEKEVRMYLEESRKMLVNRYGFSEDEAGILVRELAGELGIEDEE